MKQKKVNATSEAIKSCVVCLKRKQKVKLLNRLQFSSWIKTLKLPWTAVCGGLCGELLVETKVKTLWHYQSRAISRKLLKNPPLPVAVWHITIWVLYFIAASKWHGKGTKCHITPKLNHIHTYTCNWQADICEYFNAYSKTVYIAETSTKKPSLQKFRLCLNEQSSEKKKYFKNKKSKKKKIWTANEQMNEVNRNNNNNHYD